MSELIATIRRIDKCYDLMEKVSILWQEGVRILRINLGKSMDYEKLTRDITDIKQQWGDMKILLDIPYPGEKVRIRSKKTYEVSAGDRYYFCGSENLSDSSDYETVKMSCQLTMQVGETLLYNDGEGMFTIVEEKDGGYIVEANGNFTMLDSKSLSVKSEYMSSFSVKDIAQIPMDFLALSFVETAEVVSAVKTLFRDTAIIAKIETITGFQNIDSILDASDGIMIARGDLGLNVPIKDFAFIESRLAEKAKQQNKICFAATDIMQTMRNGFFPSRADINDFYYLSSLDVDGYIISLQLAVSDNIRTTIGYMRQIDDSLR